MSSPSFKALQQRPQGVVAVLEVDFLVLGGILNPVVNFSQKVKISFFVDSLISRLVRAACKEVTSTLVSDSSSLRPVLSAFSD